MDAATAIELALFAGLCVAGTIIGAATAIGAWIVARAERRARAIERVARDELDAAAVRYAEMVPAIVRAQAVPPDRRAH